MRIFVIEAYGGKATTDGAIRNFTVQADSLEEAVGFVRASALGQRYRRFECVSETADFEADEPGIISEQEGAYLPPA